MYATSQPPTILVGPSDWRELRAIAAGITAAARAARRQSNLRVDHRSVRSLAEAADAIRAHLAELDRFVRERETNGGTRPGLFDPAGEGGGR